MRAPYLGMDNRTIDVVSRGHGDLKAALSIAWRNTDSGSAEYFRVAEFVEDVSYLGAPVNYHVTELREDPKGVSTLILSWGDVTPEKHLLPYPLDEGGALSFIEGWLRICKFPDESDIDGDCEKGWRLFTECWGHVAGDHYAIVAVQPVWALLGK